MVRNLKHSLLKVEPASNEGTAVKPNGSTPPKRARVGVLISGTGERPASLLVSVFGPGDFCVRIFFLWWSQAPICRR